MGVKDGFSWPQWASQSANSTISAVLSLPPEMASPTRSLAPSAPPNKPASSSASTGPSPAGVVSLPDRDLSASRALALELGRGFDVGRRIRKLGAELAVGGAGGVLLAEPLQRHGELEKALGCFGTAAVALVPLEEGAGRRAILAAYIERFAEPVLGVAGQRIVGVALKERVKS